MVLGPVNGYKQPNWPPNVGSTKAVHTMELRETQPPMHLYEIDLETRRITRRTNHADWSDFEPTYCADGRIVFVSDRAGRAPQCGSFRYDMTATNLFVISADGNRIAHLTDNKDYDRYPHSLDNGLISYTHWEYQERHFMEVHSIWTVRPDGTMADALYKHHMPAPLALRDTRSVPGSNRLISIATGHHTFAYGPVVLVDPSHGTNAVSGLSIVTPGVRPQEGAMAGRVVPGGGVPDRGGLYRTPWALAHQPHVPQPPPWGADRLLGFEWLVQPILDRHCVRCHGSKDPDGDLDFSATRAADGLLQSLHTMFGRRSGSRTSAATLVSVADRFDNSAVTRPFQFGSHRSPLVRVLLDDELHRKEAKLSSSQWQSLVTWIDANAPYHDSFFNKRPSDGDLPRRETATRKHP